jgi:predicted Zn-dependent peptidase
LGHCLCLLLALLFASVVVSFEPASASKATLAAGLPKGVKFVSKRTIIDGTPEAELYRFDNGLRLLFVPDKRNPVATMRIHLDAGSNRERPGITGLAHFFEHMMFRKTQDQQEGQFDRILSGIGGSGNAATGTDFVVYESVFPGPALEIMVDLEKRRFEALDLTDPYFTTEKGAVISERRMRYENNPQQRGFEHIRTIVERGTAREWLTIGTRQDVENMKISDAQAFYKTHYVPANTLITIGGPFGSMEVVARVHQAFGNWKGGTPPAHRSLPADYASRDLGKSFICREAVGEQVVQVLFPSLKTDYDEMLMAHVASELLDDSSEGDFSRRLVNANLATGFGLYKTYWQHDSQPIAAYFRLAGTQDPDAAIKKFASELEVIKNRDWGESFRKRLQKRIDVDMATTAEKMTSLVQSYEWNLTNYGDYLISRRFQKFVDELTVKKLRSWMTQNLDLERSFTTGVTGLEGYPACSDLTIEGKK